MKIRKYLFLSLVVLLSSCTKWLDVTPKDIVDEGDLFKSHLGYRNALNGIYKQMAGTSMYGKELTWGFLDVLAQPYYSGSNMIGTTTTYYKVMSYKYEDAAVKPFIEAIWTKTYNSIANCNNLIERLEDADSTVFPLGEIERKLMLGETLGLRAFLHLDVLRLFAPAPIVDDQKLYIPYFDKFPSYGEENHTVKEVLDKVVVDLKKAKDLVAPYDTLSEGNTMRLTLFYGRFHDSDAYAPEDVFYAYRGYRMNYPAIAALLARAYNYAGDHDSAFAYAKEVIDLKDYYGSSVFKFSSKANAQKDRKIKDDLIFAVSSTTLYDDYLPYTVQSGRTSTCFVLKDWEALFDDPADYRKDVLATKLSTASTYYRSTRNIQLASEEGDICPVIRCSEMYYILAEYYASKKNWQEAINQLDIVRDGRNCTKGRLHISDEVSFKNELLKEVRREYITEGQIFYYYKKLNTLCSSSMKVSDFTLPLPDSENIN